MAPSAFFIIVPLIDPQEGLRREREPPQREFFFTPNTRSGPEHAGLGAIRLVTASDHPADTPDVPRSSCRAMRRAVSPFAG